MGVGTENRQNKQLRDTLANLEMLNDMEDFTNKDGVYVSSPWKNLSLTFK